jgi:hypothetical protein
LENAVLMHRIWKIAVDDTAWPTVLYGLTINAMIEAYSRGGGFFWYPREVRRSSMKRSEYTEEYFDRFIGEDDMQTFYNIFYTMVNEVTEHTPKGYSKWAKANSINNQSIKTALQIFGSTYGIAFEESVPKDLSTVFGNTTLETILDKKAHVPVYQWMVDIHDKARCIFKCTSSVKRRYQQHYHTSYEELLTSDDYFIDNNRSCMKGNPPMIAALSVTAITTPKGKMKLLSIIFSDQCLYQMDKEDEEDNSKSKVVADNEDEDDDDDLFWSS